MAASASADTASSLWYCGPGKAEIRQELLSTPRAGEIRVKTLYSAISRGTESLVFDGRVPESEFGRMRAPFMDGDFPFPVKYGYAAVGRVEDGGPLRGRSVYALHPQQTAINITASSLVALPDEIPPLGRATADHQACLGDRRSAGTPELLREHPRTQLVPAPCTAMLRQPAHSHGSMRLAGDGRAQSPFGPVQD